MKLKKIIIGTRGSQLSLTQTTLIKDQLQLLLPKTEITIQIVKTTGDKNMNPVPLDSIGKGWFTKELDKELLAGTIDMAVHSLKDLPEILPPSLIIAAIPKREDARDALVTTTSIPFKKLKKGSVIGTDSTRRKAQILHQRPDLIVKSLRGNVNRRLEKLDNGEYDAICLAVAGLKRIGLASRITEYFDETDIIPSPGQGALAIVVKDKSVTLRAILKKLNDKETIAAVKAERAFSLAVGGGCQMPIGAYAKVVGKKIILHGVLGSLDGTQLEKDSITGDSTKPLTLGKLLASRLLKTCKTWYRMDVVSAAEYVVVTRPKEEDDEFEKQLQSWGLKVLLYPTIEITKNILSPAAQKEINDLENVDWILFTSRNGIRFFMQALNELGIDPKVLQTKSIGAVGPKTAEEAKKYGLQIHFIPSEFTGEDLAKELVGLNGKKLLLPRATISTPAIVKQLEKKGAHVVGLPIYKTTLVEKPNKQFLKLIKENKIKYLTFTSPSTIEGLLKNADITLHNAILSLPVISIGPVTTAAAKHYGFTNVYTADIHTTEGMLTKVQEIYYN
jgi:hydroxymethylbilane synthase